MRVLVLSGDVTLDGEPLQERALYYVGTMRSEASVSSRNGGRLLLIGGPPFPETILMWWNFVARTEEEIAQARADWEEGQPVRKRHSVQGASAERSESGALRSAQSR